MAGPLNLRIGTLSIARGSLFETQSWVDLLKRSGYVSEERAGELSRSCEEIARMLTGTMKPLKSARTIREEPIEYVVDADE